MRVVEMTRDNFVPLIEASDMLVIDFTARRCDLCEGFTPVFEAASGRHPSTTFALCDADAQDELAALFGITAVPTVAVVRGGVVIFRDAGIVGPEVLDEIVEKSAAADLDDIKRRIARQKEEWGGEPEA